MSKADRTKRVRSERSGVTLDPKLGARPIRTRGWYRAVKRGEPWAIKWDRSFGFIKMLHRFYPVELIEQEIRTANTLLDMMKMDSPKSIIVPFGFKKEEEK